MLVEFSLKFVYSTMCENIFKFIVSTFLEKALNIGIFLHAPHDSKLALSSCHHTRDREKLLIPSRQHFFENLFPPTTETDGGNYDLLYQNLIRKYEDNLEH